MTKLILGFLTLGLLVSSSCDNSRGISNKDSVNQKDLIPAADKTREKPGESSPNINHSPKINDTSLQDQAGTQLSDEDFANKIPDPIKLLKNKDKYLKALGYQGNLKKSKNASQGYNESQKGIFVFSSGSKKCEVSLFIEYEKYGSVIGCDHYEYKVTISGDDSALENFYKKAEPLGSNGDYGFSSEVTKNGNTVILSGGGC